MGFYSDPADENSFGSGQIQIHTALVESNPDLFDGQALLYCCEDNATAVVVPFGSWGKGDISTSMFYSFGRSMIGSSRFG